MDGWGQKGCHAGWDLAPRPLRVARTHPVLVRLKRLVVVLVKVVTQVALMAQQTSL